MRKHGHSGSPEYQAWKSMVKRCTNPNQKFFPSYGGRGITVCDRWRHSFENFLADMGPRPTGMSLDRINNDGNYEPSNCRWASVREQHNNTRSNRLLTVGSETHTVAEWARLRGIHKNTLYLRISQGWPPERVIEPVHRLRRRVGGLI